MNSVISTGNTLTGILTGSDIETPMLTFTMATLPAYGSISLTSTGLFLYTPAF